MYILMYSHDTYGLGHIRRNIILATAQAFHPAIFLVDKAPLDLKNEVLPTLRGLSESCPKTKLVLGLRDFMDSPEHTIKEWRETKIYEALEELYDQLAIRAHKLTVRIVKFYRKMEKAILAARGLLEYIPWEEITPGGMHDKIRPLLVDAGCYETVLGQFPMTAFAVFNSRIRSFGEAT